MNLTQFAFRYNRIVYILIALLVLSGIAAFFQLPKATDPGFTIRTAVITTQFPGANPERVELLVTDKLEKKAQEMPEVDFITSESRNGVSIINVNFLQSYKNMRPIFDDLRRKVEDVKIDLPENINGPFVNDEFGDVFGSVYTLTGDGYSYAELKDVADDIRDRLLKLPDVAKVEIHGDQEEAVFVEYNNARLAELGISPKQLSSVLSTVNILSSGGDVLTGRERIVLEPTGNFESIEDLRTTVIQIPDGGVVYLGDIANIYRDYKDPPSSVARANGQSTLAVAISMRDGGDITKLGAKLDLLMPDIQALYPWGVEIEKIWFEADLVEANIDNFILSLLQAVGIVCLVVILFLGLKTGVVVATLIPVAMVIAMYVMQVFGITINQISLAALIISLGLLVDNAIVMVESVIVKFESGLSAINAAIDSGRELFLPLLTSSLTTSAAFLPIGLAESNVGEYTSDIFYVVTITLLVSFCVAMTLIPMLAAFSMRNKKQKKNNVDQQEFTSPVYVFYKNVLLISLKHKLLFGIIIISIFFLAIKGIAYVRVIFIEPSEDPVFNGALEMPLGTSIETSQAVIEDIDHYIYDAFYKPKEGRPKIKNWLTFVGSGGPRLTLGLDPPNQNPANSFLIGNVVTGKDVEPVIQGIENYAAKKYPDLNLRLSRLENGPPVGYPIQVRLSGPEFKPLYTIAEQITEYLYAQPEVYTVKNTWGKQTKKLLVEVDQERARRAGVTSDDVAYSLKASLTGIDMTEFREDDKLIPITLRSIAADRQDIGKLDGTSVYSEATGEPVPLKQVADVRLVFEPGIIERRDRDRTITLKAKLHPGATANDVNINLSPWLIETQKSWPKDYYYNEGGESEEADKGNASIAAKMPIAGMVILLLLVAQFNSVRRPIIIFATIPLGIIGVTFGLLVANSSIGFFTILGIISLAGIIINNAIVLIDRIKIEIEELGKQQAQAIVDACLQRVRPILLTTGTTVLGMMPLWWGGTAMFRPMAVTIIFGLLFATFLTLLLVPVLYSLFFRVSFKSYS
ncbi:MAG: efflux RND transporter permease subunit [Gammaproteobacteria bacterium]